MAKLQASTSRELSQGRRSVYSYKMPKPKLIPGYTKQGVVDLRRLPRFIERALGQERADGMALHHQHQDIGQRASCEPTMWLDIGLTGRKELEITIHEAIHLCLPFLYETVVTKAAKYIAMILWSRNFRRVDEIEKS